MITMLAPFKNYDALKTDVTQTLLQGQKKIEALKVEVYWKTGDLISRYLNSSGLLASELLPRLSEDLKIEKTLFYRILKFHDSFPRVAPGQLSWTHYRELMAVPDATKRTILERETLKNDWPVRRLKWEIVKRREIKREASGGEPGLLLEPVINRIDIRRIKFLETVDGKKQLVVDLGFHNYKVLNAAAGLKEKDFIQWNEKIKRWQKAGTQDDLYVYEGVVERVVDGDTLLVHVDLGFGLKRRQYLRLRGLNAPEMDHQKGRRARDFLLRLFSKNPACRFKSRFTDKYDRYLSDVWQGNRYLNQALLDRGLAVKV